MASPLIMEISFSEIKKNSVQIIDKTEILLTVVWH